MSQPWITDGKPQQSSTSPDVTDLYQSPTVFSNGVPIVLYAAPSGSGGGAFAGDIPAPQSQLNQISADQFASSTSATSADTIEAGGPAETQDSDSPITDTPGQVDIASTGGALIPWLEARVAEGLRGSWLRVNPPAPAGIVSHPGNPNIANIWKSLGMAKGMFVTDQPAWCMGFVNFALKSCGYIWCPEASAKSIAGNPGRWKATKIPLNQAQPGDIALWNYSHVNFVYTVANGVPTSFIGGNQSSKAVTNNNNPHGSTVSRSHDNPSKIVGIFRPHKGA